MLEKSTYQEAKKIRRKIVDIAYQCGESTHIGGSLSMVDILTVLFSKILKYKIHKLNDPDRDIFILSKGHCVLGYYSVMNFYRLMTDELLNTFQTNGSHLIAHPVKILNSVLKVLMEA